jgi:hypothetical protein
MYTSSGLKETLKIVIFLDECIFPLCISVYKKKFKKKKKKKNIKKKKKKSPTSATCHDAISGFKICVVT